MSLPPKLVTILCFLQLFFVATGYLVTRAFLKIYDKAPPGMHGSHSPAIPPLVGFVRAFGLWFLLVPIVWSLAAALGGDRDCRVVSITLPQLIIGIMLTVSLTLVFSFSALCAMRVSLYPV